MASLDTSIANAGLPTLAHSFGAPFHQIQWVVLAYLLAITTLIVSVGRLGDMVGRRKLLLAGIALFTGASLLCGLAPGLSLLIAARAAQGLGAAVMMALTIAFVGETVPQERTGSAMGLLGTMSAIGTALGPSLGGFLIAGVGWRAIFLFNVPVGILALFLAWRYLPTSLRETRSSFDVAGTVLLGLALASYALAMTTGGGRFGPLNITLIAGALLSGFLFIVVEGRVKFPLLRLGIFSDRLLSGSLAMSALVSTVMMSTLVVGPFYLARALGLNAVDVGLALSVGPAVVALTGVPAGRLADHFGARRISGAGLAAMAVGSLLLCMTSTSMGPAGYLGPIIVLTAGYALFQTSNNTVVMAGVSSDQRGVISGMLSLSRNLGLITGASVMGAVFALASGAREVSSARPELVASGMRTTFGVAAGLIVVAMSIALVGAKRVSARA